jgi:hypothetical protein
MPGAQIMPAMEAVFDDVRLDALLDHDRLVNTRTP